MQHEKIFKRDTIEVLATVFFENEHNHFGPITPVYKLNIKTRLIGKRKWGNPIDTDSYRHRMLQFPDGRLKDIEEQKMNFISKEELYQIKLELWEKLKPVL